MDVRYEVKSSGASVLFQRQSACDWPNTASLAATPTLTKHRAKTVIFVFRSSCFKLIETVSHNNGVTYVASTAAVGQSTYSTSQCLMSTYEPYLVSTKRSSGKNLSAEQTLTRGAYTGGPTRRQGDVLFSEETWH